MSTCIGLVSVEGAPAPALAATGARGIFISWASFWSLLLLVVPHLLGVFHRLLGCFLTETGLDQEGLESFLRLFPLDLKAVIVVVVRLTTMPTLNACLKFGDQCVGVQLSFASSTTFAFSSSSTFSFARAFSSLVALAFFLRDS